MENGFDNLEGFSDEDIDFDQIFQIKEEIVFLIEFGSFGYHNQKY